MIKFTATTRNKTCGTRARFVIVKGRIHFPPLINKDTLLELGMLHIREDGLFAEMNDQQIPEEVPDVKTVKTKSSKALTRSGTRRMIKISMPSSA